MSLRGQGVVAIWNGIRAEGRANFYEWHNREHMPERVGIPGFLAGRRWQSAQAQPEFFTLYETESPSVLDGPDYLARLNSPTEWTRRSVPFFTDIARSLCHVEFSRGVADGAWMQTWRYELAGNDRSGHTRQLRPHLEAMLSLPGVVGVHLCAADAAASAIQTEEKKGRPTDAMPGWVLMVETAGDEPFALAQRTDWISPVDLHDAGAAGHIEVGWYRLQVMHLPPVPPVIGS
ncbi:MAG: hypothetical protein ACO305_12970 [Rubrivivax sp.]